MNESAPLSPTPEKELASQQGRAINSGLQTEQQSSLRTPLLKSPKFWIRLVMFVLICGAVYRPVSHLINTQRETSYKAQCKKLVETEAWDSLFDVASRWNNWSPASSDGNVFLAEAHVQLGNFEEAATALGQVEDSYHGALEALAAQGEILFSELSRPYDAEACWLRMLTINKRADVPRQRLIYFYAMSLQRQKLISLIHESMQLGCEPPEAYTYLIMANALNFSDGLRSVTRWRRATPEDETLEVAQAIYAAKQTADNSMATFGIQTILPGDRSLLDRCLQKYPSNLEVLALSIDFLTFSADSAGVAKLLSQAPPEAEFDSRFWRYRGWLLLNRQRFAEAEEALKQSLEILPYAWQSRFLLADVQRKQGKSREADHNSVLATIGKGLQNKLFEQPNAREFSEEIAVEIYDYLQKLGPSPALEAIQRRF